MKNIFFIFCILMSFNSFSQIDSSKIKISIQLQGRDIKYIGSFVYNSQDFEGFYDVVKVKFRPPNTPPNNLDVVAIDSVGLGELLKIEERLRGDELAIKNNVFKRFGDVLKAVPGQSYLLTVINRRDTEDSDAHNATIQFGNSRLRKQ